MARKEPAQRRKRPGDETRSAPTDAVMLGEVADASVMDLGDTAEKTTSGLKATPSRAHEPPRPKDRGFTKGATPSAEVAAAPASAAGVTPAPATEVAHAAASRGNRGNVQTSAETAARAAGSAAPDSSAPSGLPASGAHIHLIGVAGAGMNALAALLLARGYRVSGSDRQHSAQVERLAGEGLTFFEGHAAEQIAGADLVIISAAVGEENVELAAARAAGMLVFKRAVALGLLLEDRQTIAVAGTHGKTTTSAMLAVILRHAGLDPTFVVGGEVLDLGASAAWGAGEWAVVEADEYDRSFLQLRPAIAVITNIEPDHLDYFGSAEAMYGAFDDFIARIVPDGTLVINLDDPYLRELAVPEDLRLMRCAYQATEWHEWHISQAATTPAGAAFRVNHSDRSAGRDDLVTLALSGLHNVQNAALAIAAAAIAGVAPGVSIEALRAFRGAGRRFQIVGEEGGVLVVDDYAHHPTEIRATLAAARARYPQRRLVAIFQPHTHSRTRLLFEDFTTAFDGADVLVLTAIYAARERDTLGVDAASLVGAIAARPGAPPVELIADLDALPGALAPRLEAGDVVLTMGAGSITTMGPRLLAELAAGHSGKVRAAASGKRGGGRRAR